MVYPKRFSLLAMMMLMLILSACASDDNDASKSDENDADSESEELALGGAPSMDDLDPDDPKTEYIKKGEEVFNETNTVMPDNVGNELSCQSCHADGGLAKDSPMVGVTTQFPQFRSREGVVFTIEDRINGCMVRSMNGEKIPEDSKEMRSLVSYMSYISDGIEEGQEDIPWRMQNTMEEIPEPDVDRGEELYEEKNCMSCHADDGSGTDTNSGPPLWGDDSFNDGAGMSRMAKMAGFLEHNMPPGDEDNLTDQEAADLAGFLLSHERPEWDGHDSDWPDGGRPSDIIDKDRREQIREGSFDWTEIDNIIPADEAN